MVQFRVWNDHILSIDVHKGLLYIAKLKGDWV